MSRESWSQRWLISERRTKELIAAETDVCPFAGSVHFNDVDGARYCLSSENGGSCTCFRAKPFEECPSFLRIGKS